MRQAHFAVGDRLHQAQGQLYQTNSEIGSLEAQIKFVIESRSRLQSQLATLNAQRSQWQAQGQDYQEQLTEAEFLLEEFGARVEESQMSAEQRRCRRSTRRRGPAQDHRVAREICRQQQIELSAHPQSANILLYGDERLHRKAA
jgi:chromosome segregation protein